ncbi:MAG: hypothetical protein ACYDA3_03775 [Gaiellaceae bacterium]
MPVRAFPVEENAAFTPPFPPYESATSSSVSTMDITLVAAVGVFSSSHIAVTAAITGALALGASFAVLGRRAALAESVVIGGLAAIAVFLWRRSANMPQLNNDGLSGFSANDWLAPTITFVVLSLYGTVRRGGNDRRFAQAAALATLAAFVVNVVTI